MDGYRMSPQQARLWGLATQAAPAAYRAECVVLIEGALERTRFEAALSACVARHELLRTSLLCLSAMTVPLQVIGEQGRVELSWHDLGGQGDAALDALLARQHGEACAVDEGPMMRLAMARLADDRHALIIDCPSLFSDSHGLRNLVAALAHAYAGQDDGAEPLQYADLAEWQCEMLESPNAEVGRDYWRRLNLAEALRARLPQVTDARRAAPFAPQRHSVECAALAATLGAFAERHGVAPAAVMLAAWQTYLARLCGAPEMVIAHSCEGRGYDELKDALGLVARNVPAHSAYDGGLDFATLVKRVDAALVALERWQECHAPQGAEGAAADDLLRLPFGFEFRAAAAPLASGGLRFTPRDEYCCFDEFELKLVVAAGAAPALDCEWQYDPARLDARRVAFIADGYLSLLADALTRGDAALATLAMVGAAEHAFIDEALSGAADNREAQCVHDMIACHAEHRPHAIALVDEHRQLDYARFVGRATQLAARLQAAGVGPEVRVALCVPRGVELMVGMLGILLAGGAYVPIDPQLPAARQRYIADDSDARIVVGMASLADSELLAARTLVALDDGDAAGAALQSVAVTPANAAYVLYTSGSTGEPKGVVIEHRQLCNYIRGVSARLALDGPTSFALISTFGADLGNTAVFCALASGGALHLPSADLGADPEALADYFDAHAIDGLKVVPSHLHALLASPAAARLLPRRYLVLGGEALRATLLEEIAALAPRCAVFNHYGPTETTVGCICGRVDASSVQGASAALGTPLANVRLALLDEHGHAVPVGVAGELMIGGAGVARGYLGRPALDAERFTTGEQRRYRSGDLVLLRDDGQLQFVARADDQLKVRGFRVEPGEVAAALARHAEVRECVVLAERHADDDARLAAYLVPATLDTARLRCWLAEQLPEYMLPGQFVALAALPLTANGKVDRKALAALGQRTVDHGTPRVALAGTQADIAAIWCELLHIDDVRAEDKFFDLGGNSLGALQAVGRLKKATGVRVTPRDLLLQTLAQLATLIDERSAGKRASA